MAAGGPITVTHPDVTRYFMTVEEAVQLVVQAGAIGQNGEALVLEMGEPVRIADVAARLPGESRAPIEIVYTGLRPGEKLHEHLFSTGEVDVRPVHPLVSHVPVPPLTGDGFESVDVSGEPAGIIETLRVMCKAGEPEPPVARGSAGSAGSATGVDELAPVSVVVDVGRVVEVSAEIMT